MSDTLLFIPSRHRPQNVAMMHEHVGDGAVWLVEKDDEADYRAEGAEVIVAKPYPASRNLALDLADAEDATCVLSDDDLIGMTWVGSTGPEPIEFWPAVERVEALLAGTDFKLAGATPSSNAFYAGKPKTRHFCNGQFLVVAPSEPRFDVTLRVKGDYDFTCQHIARYGGVLRVDHLVPNYGTVTNPGGCVDYRTDELMREAAQRLAERWPRAITWPHPRRGDTEVLLKWKS